MRFFKMPNQIFDYLLTPRASFVYAYLLSHKNLLHTVILSYKGIAENCHMDEKTAQKAVQELVNNKLIYKETRQSYKGNLKNKYWITVLSGGWFKVEYQVFHTQIKCYDFMIYCYIKKHMDSKHCEAFPSLNAIAAGTGISHSRVVTAVQYLRRFTFINRVIRRYKRTNAHRHNRYVLFRLNQKKEKTRSHKRVSGKPNCCNAKFSFFVIIVKHNLRNVKSSFTNRGSPQFPNPL